MTASSPTFFRSRRHIRSLFRGDDLHIIPLVSCLPLPGDWLSTTPDTAVAATTGVKPQPTLEQRNLQACAWRNLRFSLNTTQSQSNAITRVASLKVSKSSQDPQPKWREEAGGRMILRHFHGLLFHFQILSPNKNFAISLSDPDFHHCALAQKFITYKCIVCMR